MSRDNSVSDRDKHFLFFLFFDSDVGRGLVKIEFLFLPPRFVHPFIPSLQFLLQSFKQILLFDLSGS